MSRPKRAKWEPVSWALVYAISVILLAWSVLLLILTGAAH